MSCGSPLFLSGALRGASGGRRTLRRSGRRLEKKPLPAEAADAGRVLEDRLGDIALVDVGAVLRREDQLGVSSLQRQEAGGAVLPGCSPHEVWVGVGLAGGVEEVPQVEACRIGARPPRFGHEALDGTVQLVGSAVVDGKADDVAVEACR